MSFGGTSTSEEFVPDLVSVIMPARNAAPWIGDALASVARQEYGPLEVIVVDDGSTDTTAAIARSFAGSFDLTVVRESGCGPAAARNRALELARGEFTQFLDADDVLEPWKIARQVTVARERDADVVWGSFERAYDDGRGLATAPRVAVYPTIGEDTACDLLSGTGFIQLGAMLVRRRGALGAVRMPLHMRVVEDVRYQFALIDAGARFTKQEALSGFVMREHADEGRASRRPLREFWTACMENAIDREVRWRAAAALTRERARTLATVYVMAARELAVLSPADSRTAAARAKAVYAEYYDFVSPKLRLATRLFGLQRIEALASLGRSIRAAARLW